MPDEIREEEVMACIVLKEYQQASHETSLEIIEWCKEVSCIFQITRLDFIHGKPSYWNITKSPKS